MWMFHLANKIAKSYTDEETRALIERDARAGVLSDVPVQLGESIQPLIDQNRLLRVPDRYPGGRYCQLEAPVFRRVLILTDELSNTYEDSASLSKRVAESIRFE